MKLSKKLGRKHGFVLLLLVASCLLFAMFYSRPQAFQLLDLNRNEVVQPYVQKNDIMVISESTDNNEKNGSREDGILGIEQQSNQNIVVHDGSNNDLEKVTPSRNEASDLFFVDDTGGKVQQTIQSMLKCDFSDRRSDTCNMTGDVRTKGYNISTVFFVPPPGSFDATEKQWSLNAYSQKMYMYFTKNVTVKQLSRPQNAPICTVDQSNTPAILISLGGTSGNIWHDFTDMIIPLFLAAKQFNRDVQFLLINYQQWFVDKFSLVLKDLSRYDVINFDEDKEIRCYQHMLVGLLNHKDFGIDPYRAFDGYNMFRFKMYIRSIYSLPMDTDIPYKMNQLSGKKPRLMLVVRSKTRRFLNQEEVVEVIEKTGFELVQVEPKGNDNLTEVSKLVDSCDVLMGVHGAALTNMIFLRPNALMLQVIPLGGGSMDDSATSCYGAPADEMSLRRIDYHITPEESSLLEKYGWDNPVVNDPDSINRKGWMDSQKYYWKEQDVRLNVSRFEPVLVKALELLKE